MVKSGRQADYHFRILESVIEINEQQKTILFDPILDFFGGTLAGKTIALWGLAFKPDTDDIREAPALYMIDKIVAAGGKVKAFDPEAMENVKKLKGDAAEYCSDEYTALEGADALLICTEWGVFRNPDFKKIGESLNQKVIYDGRNLYDTDKMKERGFHYKSIYRQTIAEVEKAG